MFKSQIALDPGTFLVYSSGMPMRLPDEIIPPNGTACVAHQIETADQMAIAYWLQLQRGAAVIKHCGEEQDLERDLKVILRHIRRLEYERVAPYECSFPLAVAWWLWLCIGECRDTQLTEQAARLGKWDRWWNIIWRSWRLRVKVAMAKLLWPRCQAGVAEALAYIALPDIEPDQE